jgi:hypothetical protein
LHTCPALTPSPSVQSTHVPPPPAREISTADQWWIWFLYGFYSILFSPFESFLSELHSNYKLTLGWLTVFHKKCLVNKFFGANSWTSYFRGLFKVAIFIQEKTDFVLFFFVHYLWEIMYAHRLTGCIKVCLTGQVQSYAITILRGGFIAGLCE